MTWPHHTGNSLDHLPQVLLYLLLPVESCDHDVPRKVQILETVRRGNWWNLEDRYCEALPALSEIRTYTLVWCLNHGFTMRDLLQNVVDCFGPHERLGPGKAGSAPLLVETMFVVIGALDDK